MLGATDATCSNQEMGFQGYYGSNGADEDGQRFMVEYSGDEKPKLNGGLWGETEMLPLMDYGLEEIKQLISTSNITTSNNNNLCNNIISFDQEIKTEMEGVVYL